MWTKYVSNNVWRAYRLPVSIIATVAQKAFNSKFISKINFPIHILFDKYAAEILTKSYFTKYAKF